MRRTLLRHSPAAGGGLRKLSLMNCPKLTNKTLNAVAEHMPEVPEARGPGLCLGTETVETHHVSPCLHHGSPCLHHVSPCLRHVSPCLHHVSPCLRHGSPCLHPVPPSRVAARRVLARTPV